MNIKTHIMATASSSILSEAIRTDRTPLPGGGERTEISVEWSDKGAKAGAAAGAAIAGLPGACVGYVVGGIVGSVDDKGK